MALKALMLRKKIDTKKKELEALRAKDADFEKRESELTASIEEASTDEETQAVNEEIEKFETEKGEHEAAKSELESTIEGLENELRETEKETETPAEPTPAPEARANNKTTEVRAMDIAKRSFREMNIAERTAMMEREDVKSWLGEIRAHISEKRELTNVGLTIPEVFLGFLRQNVENYSKLYKHVTVRSISGTGREVIMGSVPEAIWTECCGALNELSVAFNDAEVDCYKVGGFFKVCNAVLEDSDLDLAAELLDAIGQAIGLALDKAILYGRNTSANNKMPLGIVSRLAQTSQPSGYPATARPWVDLHTSNIKTTNNTGVQLFQDLIVNAGAAKGKYARGSKVWVMNETTYTYLQAQALSINASGAIVSGMNGTMPIIGGVIEVLDFIPDNVIIGGYFELYLLAERGGAKFAQSEHAFFLQDQTAFKGTARYDGQPVIAEGFVALGVKNTTPDASMTFVADKANVVDLAELTGVTLSPSFDAGTTVYTAATTNTKDAITAIAEDANAKVTVYYTTGTTTKQVVNGSQITWAAGADNVVKVVVENGNSTKTYQVTVTKS